jgi:hypothetical protein
VVWTLLLVHLLLLFVLLLLLLLQLRSGLRPLAAADRWLQAVAAQQHALLLQEWP